MSLKDSILQFEAEAPVFVGTEASARGLPDDYLRLRDFEYAQPLYDLAYFLEADAIAKGHEIPKFRTFSLWRAAYSFDGYSTLLDKWIDGEIGDDSLDYVPSSRIKGYLLAIQQTGTIPELQNYSPPRFSRLRRLRAVKSLGLAHAAKSLNEADLPSEQWMNAAVINTQLSRETILKVYTGSFGTWQSAHIVPPLVRFLHEFQEGPMGSPVNLIEKSVDGISPVSNQFLVKISGVFSCERVQAALSAQPLFKLVSRDRNGFVIAHQLGWYFRLEFDRETTGFDLMDWTTKTDPLLQKTPSVKADLHLHTAWSDGNASLESMAMTIKRAGLSHFAVTDHSRSCKVQGGLTPILWLRQAASISLNRSACPILHGIEVDILEDGSLDLPAGLLSGMDIVIASVHSNWTKDKQSNTRRLINAIETGLIDVMGHPTSAVVGKPGVPDYVRPHANIDWDAVFVHCAKWRVALELNCFPSRLDLPLNMLKRAIEAGCWISLGSDAHARAHLSNLKFGEAILKYLPSKNVLNYLEFEALKEWLRSARHVRRGIPKSTSLRLQLDLFSTQAQAPERPKISTCLNPPQRIPEGSRIIGFDLTAGKSKPTGVAMLDGMAVTTCSLESDQDLLDFLKQNKPAIVSIDSPLGFPGGGSEIDPAAGIVRIAEHDLSSVGIPAYPALIDSMRELTCRGVRLRRMIEAFERPPVVIESYPGAAQDVLCIPRKQKSLELLRGGLRELGLTGSGLLTESHDEMDAITSAVVGRFYEIGQFQPMGVSNEAQLIVPTIKPLRFDIAPIICLAGKTGSGKSVVARYLSLFYGFRWLKTRNIIRELLEEDLKNSPSSRMYGRNLTPKTISDRDLRDFGLVILEKCQQKPLRKKLGEEILRSNEPLVIDSIRDVVDLDRSCTARPVYVWFIECTDQIINNRLIEKTKIASFRSRPTVYPIDQKIPLVRDRSNCIISNVATLEDLRWKVDDTLFEIFELATSCTKL